MGDAPQQVGRHLGRAQTGGIAICQRLLDLRFNLRGRNLILFRHRYRHQQSPRQFQRPLCPPDFRHLLGRVTTDIDRKSAAATVEGGELLGAVADDGYAVRFQVFERGRQVQQCLGAGADDDNRGLRQFLQVGADIGAGAGRAAAVDAADAARGEQFDAGAVGDPHGGGNGRGPVQLAGDDDGQVAAAHLAHRTIGRCGQPLYLLRAEAGDQLSADDADGGRNRAMLADDALHFMGQFQVVRVGQPVADYGRFQCNPFHIWRFRVRVFNSERSRVRSRVASLN